MKIRSYSICPTCEKKINSLGFPCSSLMELLIDLYLKAIPFTFNDSINYDRPFKTPIEYLEKKGFVLSRDIGKGWIQVIPRTSGYNSKRLCWC